MARRHGFVLSCQGETFYDSVSGKPLFVAPKGRTWKEFEKARQETSQSFLFSSLQGFLISICFRFWSDLDRLTMPFRKGSLEESFVHGWPSFRDEE